MILPERRSIMCGSTARQEFTAPSRLISIVFVPGLGLVGKERPDGPLHACGGDEDIQAAENRAHAVHRGGHLSRSRTSARMRRALPPACSISSLARSSLRLAARQQPYARAGLGETESQAFANSAAGAGDQDGLIAHGHQAEIPMRL